MNFVLSESELYLKVVPMDWIIFFVILGHLKMFDIRHAIYLIQSTIQDAGTEDEDVTNDNNV